MSWNQTRITYSLGFICWSCNYCTIVLHFYCTFRHLSGRNLRQHRNVLDPQEDSDLHLRLAAGHVIAPLHDVPDLPGDGAVGNNHYARRYDQDQQQHVDLVETPQWRLVHSLHTVVRLVLYSDQDMFLLKENRKTCFMCHNKESQLLCKLAFYAQCSRIEPYRYKAARVCPSVCLNILIRDPTTRSVRVWLLKITNKNVYNILTKYLHHIILNRPLPWTLDRNPLQNFIILIW